MVTAGRRGAGRGARSGSRAGPRRTRRRRREARPSVVVVDDDPATRREPGHDPRQAGHRGGVPVPVEVREGDRPVEVERVFEQAPDELDVVLGDRQAVPRERLGDLAQQVFPVAVVGLAADPFEAPFATWRTGGGRPRRHWSVGRRDDPEHIEHPHGAGSSTWPPPSDRRSAAGRALTTMRPSIRRLRARADGRARAAQAAVGRGSRGSRRGRHG